MKKGMFGLFAVVLMAVIGISAFAATTANDGEKILKRGGRILLDKENLTEEQLAEMKENRVFRTEKREDLTEEQIAEMKAEKEKWANLTDAQKAELNDLEAKGREIRNQMVDKYLEFGLVTEDQAAKMKEQNENVKDGFHVEKAGFGAPRLQSEKTTESK